MARKRTKRSDDISARPAIKKKLLDLYKDVEQGFTNERERVDHIMDFWELYNCVLGARQFYNGNSKIYVPIIRNAVKARKTRFLNQLFPRSGRYIECTTDDGTIPHALMSLMEHYIKRAKLKSQVIGPLLVNGDVEGQYNCYVDWSKIERHVVSRETSPVEIEIDGEFVPMPEMGDTETISEETEDDAGPVIEVLHDADVLVLPATTDSIEAALEDGGSVTVVRRWTKAKVRKMAEEGAITEDAADDLVDSMQAVERDRHKDAGKELADVAGIKAKGKHVVVYETWTKLKVDGEYRLCQTFYGGHDMILGARLNPFWCDLCPVLSAPVEKANGVFKGMSPLKGGVADLQIAANDAVNEGMDAAAYALMPIIMTDPEKNPRVGTMVLDLATVWETSPRDTQFAQFPPLWKDAFAIVANAKQEIFQSLGINPAMMPQQTGQKGGKRNQAEIAIEQQVDLLTTAEAVSAVEEEILTPAMARFAFYDQQFRDDDILIRGFGEMGRRVQMETVPPLQLGKRWTLVWLGVEAARNAAQQQQQIATINVLRGLGAEKMPGYRLNLIPMITALVEAAWGPRIAPLIFEDMRDQLTVPAQEENAMLEQGMDLQVHPMDNDQEHLRAHMELMRQGDPYGVVRVHMQRHTMQMQAKNAAQQQQSMGAPGVPGGNRPGVAGTPRPGAQPSLPRQGFQPPGAIRPDNMARAGAPVPPRRA